LSGRGHSAKKEQLTVPIEAINLKSIQVTVFKIYGQNISAISSGQ